MSTPKSKGNSSRTSDVLTTIITEHGELLEIYYHLHSGRIISRKSVYVKNAYEHGIIVGADKYGNFWIASHISGTLKPSIGMLCTFSSGIKTIFDPLPSAYACIEVAKRAVTAVIKAGKEEGSSYKHMSFVDAVITKTEERSFSHKLSDGAMLMGILSVFLRIIE